MSASPTPTCPSDSTLQRMLHSDCDLDTQTQIEKHLDVCLSCRDRLEKLAGDLASLDLQRIDSDALGPDSTCSQTTDQVKRNLLQIKSKLLDLNTIDRPKSTLVNAGKTEEKFPGISTRMQPANNPIALGNFGRFEIIKLIGTGGMGAVYEAFDPERNERVALKVLRPQGRNDHDARQRFVREGKHLSRVVHNHVVRVYSIDEVEKVPCMTMELVEAPTLHQHVQQFGMLNQPQLAELAIALGEAIEAIHARIILHRDIKPSNVLVDFANSRYWLTDFGLAKAFNDVGFTASGSAVGTPEFMSPEQVRGEQLGFESDWFSLGSLLYFAATGACPFVGTTIVEIFHQVATHTPDDIRSINPRINQSSIDGIGELMIKEPLARMCTLDALRKMF